MKTPEKLKWLKTREKGLLRGSTNGRYYYRIHSGDRQHWAAWVQPIFGLPANSSEKQVATIKRMWPELTGMRIRDISKAMCEDWAANKVRTEKGKEYSANRFNTCIDTLRNILDIAVDRGSS